MSPGERLLALKEVADEARAYKMGGEDKIRVAVNTAEMVRAPLMQTSSHAEYIDSLLRSLTSLPALAPYARESRPRFRRFGDAAAYPPAEELLPMPPAGAFGASDAASSSRRARKGMPSAPAPAPAASSSRTRERELADDARNAKKRKTVPPQVVSSKGRAVIQEPASHDRATRAPGAPPGAPGAKRRGDGAFRRNGWDDGERDSDEASETYEHGQFARANRVRGRGPTDLDGDAWGARAADGTPYGAPVADSRGAARSRPTKTASVGSSRDDADDQRYCFCNNVSYGDMIGCDDDDCEREWFHLGCVGLSKPPQGTWYCDACLERRARNKAKRGGARPSRATPTAETIPAPRRIASGRR